MSATEPPFLAGLRREFERVAEADAAAGRRAPLRLPRLRALRLRVALPAATALALLAGAGAVTTGVVTFSVDFGGDGSGLVTREPETVGGWATFSEEWQEQLSVLRRERTEADVIPLGRRRMLSSDVNLDASLRILPPPGEPPAPPVMWLLPGRDGTLAIVTMRPRQRFVGVSIEIDLRSVAQGRALISIGDQLFGLVPDGVSEVSVIWDGGTGTAEVRDNLFVLDGFEEGKHPVVTWQGMSGP